MGLSTEWQTSIFSVIVPIVFSIIFFVGKKIIRSRQNIERNNEKKYNNLQKEKKEVEEKLDKMKLEETEFKKEWNKKLKKPDKINNELSKMDSIYKNKYPDVFEWLFSKKDIVKDLLNNEDISSFKLDEEEKETLSRDITHIIISLFYTIVRKVYNFYSQYNALSC
jgi:ABC-type multidrug transport system fused ATPase/permease subunit